MVVPSVSLAETIGNALFGAIIPEAERAVFGIIAVAFFRAVKGVAVMGRGACELPGCPCP